MNTSPFSDATPWIALPHADDRRAGPLLRRAFKLRGVPVRANLQISGLGWFEAWINGHRVGDHVLDPAQTDYDCRVLYVTHDVTALLCAGENALGVMLGDGWFRQDVVWSPSSKVHGIKPDGASYGCPRLLVELHAEYADGDTEVVVGSTDWRGCDGPVTASNVYAGECYDCRREQPGWTEPGFDDTNWLAARTVESPCERLEEQLMPPMRRIEELPVRELREVEPDVWVADFGQNMAGWVRLRVDGPAGTEIVLRFAEELAQDGRLDTASTGVFATEVEQIDRLVCDGKGPREWEPRFTYHGFRYVEITGWPNELRPDDLTAVVVHTDLPVAGHFECSCERLNRIHELALWTHRGNIHGLPEDCPARERCGWLGDANVVTEFSLWNFEGFAFWEKWLDDIETSRSLRGGLPGVIAPGKRNGDIMPDWAAAFIMVPWYLYLHGGDPDVFRRHWDGLRALANHFGEESNAWILEGGFGDWFDPGGDRIVSSTPPALTTTLWFLRCAEVMVRAARLLEDSVAAERYSAWPACIRTALMDRFYDPAKGTFGSQTADAMALAFEVVKGDEATRVLAALVADVHSRNDHLNVGIMGLRFLFEVLARAGHGELALRMLLQDDYPSHGYLLAKGATTLWEWWGDDEMLEHCNPRSLNHPMMGAYDNWFFDTLAGIRPDPDDPGFRHILLEPVLIDGVDWVRTYHDTAHGRVESSWRRTGGGGVEWTVAIPTASRASVRLPLSGKRTELSTGTHVLTDRAR